MWDNPQTLLSTAFTGSTFCQRNSPKGNCQQWGLWIILSNIIPAVELFKHIIFSALRSTNENVLYWDNGRWDWCKKVLCCFLFSVIIIMIIIFLFFCYLGGLTHSNVCRMVSSFCFLTRGHLPLLMVCSTRRWTGTTAMVMTGASTARGVMDSDLQVGIHFSAHASIRLNAIVFGFFCPARSQMNTVISSLTWKYNEPRMKTLNPCPTKLVLVVLNH